MPPADFGLVLPVSALAAGPMMLSLMVMRWAMRCGKGRDPPWVMPDRHMDVSVDVVHTSPMESRRLSAYGGTSVSCCFRNFCGWRQDSPCEVEPLSPTYHLVNLVR